MVTAEHQPQWGDPSELGPRATAIQLVLSRTIGPGLQLRWHDDLKIKEHLYSNRSFFLPAYLPASTAGKVLFNRQIISHRSPA